MVNSSLWTLHDLNKCKLRHARLDNTLFLPASQLIN